MNQEVVKGKFSEYFECLKKIEEINEKLSQIDYNMQGLKGVAFDSVKGNSDRQHTLIHQMMKKDDLEEERDNLEYTLLSLKNILHISTLSEEDLRMLKYVYQRKTYTQIARKMHYSGKVVVYRKLKKIYNEIAE